MNNTNDNNTNNEQSSVNNNGGNNNNNNRVITAADIPLMLKARYFGSGVVVGAIISPVLRKAVSTIQPRFDKILDNLTGQAEGLVEKGSDFVAKAREVLQAESPTESTGAKHAHAGECSH